MTLKLSRLFRRPVSVNQDRVVCDLLFNSEYFTCRFPLSAVWGLTTGDGQNMLWPGSTPAEILEQMLGVVSKTEGTGAEPPEKPEEKPRQKGGHLRRVK